MTNETLKNVVDYFNLIEKKIETIEKKLITIQPKEKDNLSIDEAMQMLGYSSKQYFQRFIKLQGIPHSKIGNNYFFSKSDLELFIRKQKGENLSYWELEKLSNLIRKAKEVKK